VSNIDPAGFSQRLPPSNLAAEQALLGALLTNNKAFERVAEFLAAHHFADPVHGAIYDAIARRVNNRQLADPVTLRAEFEHSGLLEEVGGITYLGTLVNAMVGIINAGEYGQTILDAWMRRQLIDIGEEVVNSAFGTDSNLPATDLIGVAEERLFKIATDNASDPRLLKFDSALKLALESIERAISSQGKISGLPTSLRDLDKKTGGLHGSDLVILAGRPAMGKTALATKIAFGAAESLLRQVRDEDPNAAPRSSVLFFSLEMSAEQLASRILSEEARVSTERIRRGDITARDFAGFVEASKKLQEIPLFIDDTPAITLQALRTRCRRQARSFGDGSKGLALVVIDYLQLMRPNPGVRAENRVVEISAITQGLKALAKEFHVPVIALSQLSRAVESREDKRPMLSDLRESGSIEQDADAVMFVYRDEYYLQARQPKEMNFDAPGKFESAMVKWQEDMARVHNRAEVILAKQRHGQPGKVDLFFDAQYTRFADLDQIHDGDD
jgi:replicative DNA helicase